MENKLLTIILKLVCIVIFIYFLQKYKIVDTIDKLINNKMTLKETFNNIIVPKEKAIKLSIKDQLPYGDSILKLGLLQKTHYLDDLGVYFAKHIFPVKTVNSNGCIDNINKLIRGELDLAFIDEETLANFMDDDIHLRIHLVKEQLPPINFSLLGVCFRQSFLFVTRENSGIYEFEDIKKVKYINRIESPNIIIGVLNEQNTDYFHLLKLLYLSDTSYDIKNGDVVIYTCDDYADLKEKFVTGELDIIYFTTNKKNKILKEISDEAKVRYITPYYNLEKYKEIEYSALMVKYSFSPFVCNKEVKIANTNNNQAIYYEQLFSKETVFYVFKGDFADFKELLRVCKIFFPDSNKYNNIVDNQIIKFDSKTKMREDFSKSSSKTKVFFVPQQQSLTDTIRRSYIEGLKSPYYFVNFTNSNKFLKEGANKLKKYRDFNNLVKNRFRGIYNDIINMNTSFNNINSNKQLKTYSSRLLLVARNNLDSKYVEQIVENLVHKLDDLQIHINNYMNLEGMNYKEDELYNLNKDKKDQIKKILDPYVVNAFNFNELISVKDIPIHKKANAIYERFGLLKRVVIEESNYTRDGDG